MNLRYRSWSTDVVNIDVGNIYVVNIDVGNIYVGNIDVWYY